MAELHATEPRAEPNLVQIADVFTRYANFTLGGGSATVAVMHRELLDKRRWVTADDFALCFALARLTPGTNLLAFCTGIGWVLRRMPGAVVALLAASIPCTLIVVSATASAGGRIIIGRERLSTARLRRRSPLRSRPAGPSRTLISSGAGVSGWFSLSLPPSCCTRGLECRPSRSCF
jgi:Chromate transporter